MCDSYALVQEQIDAHVHELITALRKREALPWGSPQRINMRARINELSRKIEWLSGKPPEDDGPAAPALPAAA